MCLCKVKIEEDGPACETVLRNLGKGCSEARSTGDLLTAEITWVPAGAKFSAL